jgi:anti-sigma-K factor RskA
MSWGESIPHDRAADAAAYAVGALTDEEARAYRHHLDRCVQCREQLAGFERVADVLALAVAQYPPPPRLRRRVLRAVRSAPRRPPTQTARLPRVPGARAALSGVAALAIVVALIAAFLLPRGGSVGERVLRARVLGSPGTAELRIAGGHADLVVRHLPAPATGRVYEVWLERGNRPPAPTKALFGVTSEGSADVGVPGEVDGVSEVLVTQEPTGGSRVPTGRTVIIAATS